MGGRVQGLAVVGGRLSECPAYAIGPPAGPRALLCEIFPTSRGPDHRAPLTCADADDYARFNEAAPRSSCGRPARRLRTVGDTSHEWSDGPHGAAHARDQGILHHRFRPTPCWRSRSSGHGYIAERMEQFVRDARIA